MANDVLSAFVTSLKRRALRSISEAIVSDSCLLDRFVTNGDQDAFAALVHRHGPMVLAGRDETKTLGAFLTRFGRLDIL